MATAKKAAAKPEKASESRAVVSWEEKLAAKAQGAKKVAASVSGGGGDFVSFKGGKISFQGAAVQGNEMDVVVLSAVAENDFFPNGYDPDNPQSPLCYAFGSPDGEDDDMGPFRDVLEAGNQQADRCKDCEHNQWGSAERGRGKACKNVVKLSMILAEELAKGAEAVRKAKPFYAKVPVTSGRNWAGYVNSLGEKHFLGFVTTVSTAPRKETFEVLFQAKEEIDGADVMGALLEKSDREDKGMAVAYPKFEEAPARPARRVVPVKSAPAKKPAARAAKY